MGCPRARRCITLEASLTLYPIEMVALGIMGGYSLQIDRQPLYNPVIPLLSIYPKNPKPLIRKGTCTPLFVAALPIIAKMWK